MESPYDLDFHKITALGVGLGPLQLPCYLLPISVANRGVQRALSPGRTRPCGGKGLSYLVKPMVQQDDLHLSCARALPHQHIAWVRVTVHEAVDKDHLTVHLAQVARDLKEKGGGWELHLITTCLRDFSSGPSIWPLSRGRPEQSRWKGWLEIAPFLIEAQRSSSFS